MAQTFFLVTNQSFSISEIQCPDKAIILAAPYFCRSLQTVLIVEESEPGAADVALQRSLQLTWERRVHSN